MVLSNDPFNTNTPKIEEIRQSIQDLHSELEKLGDPPVPITGLVNSTNILRTNEYLERVDYVKTDLISSYKDYAKLLESLAKSVLDIQAGLLDVLREQSAMMEKKKTTAKSSRQTLTKSARKPRAKSKKTVSKTNTAKSATKTVRSSTTAPHPKAKRS